MEPIRSNRRCQPATVVQLHIADVGVDNMLAVGAFLDQSVYPRRGGAQQSARIFFPSYFPVE
jgi:hypothetical protein